MDEALEILREYIDERIAYVTDDPEWRSKKESERLWKEFVEAFLEALKGGTNEMDQRQG